MKDYQNLIGCNYCKRKAVIIEDGTYWCADCMIAKLGIKVNEYGEIQRKNSKTKQAYERRRKEV